MSVESTSVNPSNCFIMIVNMLHFIFGSNIGLILGSILIIYFYLRYKLTFWQRQGVPNHVLHNIKVFRGIIPYVDIESVRKYGKIIGTYELFWPSLLVAEPKIVHEILVERFHEFPDHRIWALPEHNIGKSVFLLRYKKWKIQRAIISPSFTSNNLKKFSSIFEECLKSLLSNLEEYADTNKALDIRPYIEAFSMDVLTNILFGIKINSSNDPDNPIVTNSRKVFGLNLTVGQMIALFSPTLSRIFGFHAINKKAGDFMEKLSYKIIKERMKSGIKRNDLLQNLIDAEDPVSKTKLTVDEIKDNMIIFFIASFDAISSTLMHLVYCLTTNPEHQKTLIKEVDENEIDLENASKMVFLNACINECLRLFPPVARVERQSPIDCEVSNIFIPRDTNISVLIYAVHHDPDNFEDPESFKPERFLPENKHKIKPGSFIPFADGPRNCIGCNFALVEIRFCIANILKRYKFVECNETKPLKFYTGQYITLPKNVYVKIVRR